MSYQIKGKSILVGLVAVGIAALFATAATSLLEDRKGIPRRPGETFFIPEEELRSLLASGRRGDLPSIRRLIYYFERYEGNPDKAEYWSARARALGDKEELRLYASGLLRKAQYQAKDAERKANMLAEARLVAERLLASDRTAENQEFVERVKAAQSQ